MVVIFLDDARLEDHGFSYCLPDRNEPQKCERMKHAQHVQCKPSSCRRVVHVVAETEELTRKVDWKVFNWDGSIISEERRGCSVTNRTFSLTLTSSFRLDQKPIALNQRNPSKLRTQYLQLRQKCWFLSTPKSKRVSYSLNSTE